MARASTIRDKYAYVVEVINRRLKGTRVVITGAHQDYAADALVLRFTNSDEEYVHKIPQLMLADSHVPEQMLLAAAEAAIQELGHGREVRELKQGLARQQDFTNGVAGRLTREGDEIRDRLRRIERSWHYRLFTWIGRQCSRRLRWSFSPEQTATVSSANTVSVSAPSATGTGRIPDWTTRRSIRL